MSPLEWTCRTSKKIRRLLKLSDSRLFLSCNQCQKITILSSGLTGNNCQSAILCPNNLSVVRQKEVLFTIQKLGVFTTYWSSQGELLNDLPQEEKWTQKEETKQHTHKHAHLKITIYFEFLKVQ